MADLRIVDAPEIPTENITGEEKLPTGGNGNYSISLDSLADYTKTKKDLVDNITVDNKVNGVRQELDAHIEDLINPHQVTKGQIGLGNVDNTADADKPVSNSTQAAIISAVAPKADKTYVDTQLALKANKADVYTKSETYTKQESSDLVNNSISTALTPVNISLDLAKRGIANRYDSSLTYNSGECVVLANGDIVKSTIDGNANDPNVDMTGWRFDNDVVKSIAELLTIQNPKDGQCVAVTSYNPVNYALAEPYFPKGGDAFEYSSALSSRNDGGVVIDGWVRQDTTNLNAYDFGAFGNWNATNQTGDDDTAPLQKYIDYVCNKPDLRQGGVRVARLLGGNYRISALNISKYWGFTLLGEKYFTNIWVDPTGTGIDVSVEGSKFKDITFNGKLNASYHSVSDPSIDYIFKFKLTNSGFDIDTAFTDCNVAWAKNFARVSGRGFNWVGGGIGQTVGSLCDIACDADLTPSGSDQYQLTQTVMRHYKFENARCDQLGAVFNIIGTNAVKEYINGIKVTGCDLVGVNRVITGLDCRIVKPLLANNKGYGGFTNIISVPRAVDVQDIGNDWNPVPSMDSLVTTHKIPSAYVFSDSLDGFTLMSNLRNVSNNLILVGQGSMNGQVNGSGNVKNVTIAGSKIKNFSDGSVWANVINNTGTSKNISIQGNTLTSDVSTRKRWLANVTDHKSIQIKDNITEGAGFDPQELTYTPSVLVDGVVPISGLTVTISEGKYRIIDDYVECDVLISSTATPASGVLSVSLPPIPAVIINSTLSSRISGFGQVEQSFNTGIATLSVEVWTTTQAATLRNQNTDYNLTSKANPAITFSAKFKYRFK